MAQPPENFDMSDDPDLWEEVDIRYFLTVMELDPIGPLDVIRDRVIENFLTNQDEFDLETSPEKNHLTW